MSASVCIISPPSRPVSTVHYVDICPNNIPNISNTVAVHRYMYVCLCVCVCVCACMCVLFECECLGKYDSILDSYQHNNTVIRDHIVQWLIRFLNYGVPYIYGLASL